MREYLIWSVEHDAWWGPGGAGYTQRIADAGRYSHAKALDICTGAMPGTYNRRGMLPELPVRLEDVTFMLQRFAGTYLGHDPDPPA